MTAVRTDSSTTHKVLGYPLNIWQVAAWDKGKSQQGHVLVSGRGRNRHSVLATANS
ncbi:hypothetical protein [Pseudarthrobacter sulfonivorans]|uniref:hypothetical protein n=1 Tax=Pseudarthrobacter sulfonivorans TaxID=121292 RepID=UPI000A84DAED|nr:hypothetical protein [Pseudarthrobacter sulfonivorans]